MRTCAILSGWTANDKKSENSVDCTGSLTRFYVLKEKKKLATPFWTRAANPWISHAHFPFFFKKKGRWKMIRQMIESNYLDFLLLAELIAVGYCWYSIPPRRRPWFPPPVSTRYPHWVSVNSVKQTDRIYYVIFFLFFIWWDSTCKSVTSVSTGSTGFGSGSGSGSGLGSGSGSGWGSGCGSGCGSW